MIEVFCKVIIFVIIIALALISISLIGTVLFEKVDNFVYFGSPKRDAIRLPFKEIRQIAEVIYNSTNNNGISYKLHFINFIVQVYDNHGKLISEMCPRFYMRIPFSIWYIINKSKYSEDIVAESTLKEFSHCIETVRKCLFDAEDIV